MKIFLDSGDLLLPALPRSWLAAAVWVSAVSERVLVGAVGTWVGFSAVCTG